MSPLVYLSLRDALLVLTTTPPRRNYALYVESLPLESETKCALVEEDPYEDLCESIERETGLRRLLSEADVASVLSNARQQSAAVTDAELVRALEHYWRKDAYLVIATGRLN